MKRRVWIIAVVSMLLVFSAMEAGNRNSYPLPEERGTAGILSALQKLPVFARVLHITAHPDDESAGTLTWLSRRFHARTALFCLTRGEGGQNILGNEKYDALGLLRTGELLEACKYYGVELYFSKALDFGFSKSGEETLSKWDREKTLEEMVRFIRQWRPAIVISRFQGDAMDGHGHHQAAGILAREAFQAAGNPKIFPEHFKQGLQQWQASKLFISSRPAGEPVKGAAENSMTVRIPVGDYDPVLGRSYREIATEGYSKHRTQGNGASYAPPGLAYEYFKLVNSEAGIQQKDNLFDSMDTSLMAIWNLAGAEKQAAGFLRQDLDEAQQAAAEAIHSFQPQHPENSAPAVAKGVDILGKSIAKIEKSSLTRQVKEILKDALNEKLQDFQKAASAVLGISLIARTDDATAVPGEKESVNIRIFNRGSETVHIYRTSAAVMDSQGKTIFSTDGLEGKQLPAGDSAASRFSFEISPEAKATEPYWHLQNPNDARYIIRPTQNEFAPFGAPEITTRVSYLYKNIEIPITADALAQAGDPLRGMDFTEFQIVPAISITLSPGVVIIPIGPIGANAKKCEFQATILNNLKSGARGTVKLETAGGWLAEPTELQFVLSRKGETFNAKFVLQAPAGTKPGAYPVEAAAVMEGKEFRRGYQVISYPENWTRNSYSSARSKLQMLDVRVAPNLLAGYVPGAGDEIPAALEQLGVKVQTLSGDDLAFGDLGRYSTIVTGIRAYNVNENLKANSRRLLEYVEHGGTLIVQYVRPPARSPLGGAGADFSLGPYPMNISDASRITVEDSPIRILDPANPIFNQPNKITEADFEGWVQERGLYFAGSWDSRYSALISGNDPGEAPQNGGMLMTKFGKGFFVYSAYAWFRQLPAGAPGAYRIFANMISLGR